MTFLRTTIPNLGNATPQGYKAGHLGVRKKMNNGGKRHVNIQGDKSLCAPYDYNTIVRCTETFWSPCINLKQTSTIVITNILIILRVQFMGTGCQGGTQVKTKSLGTLEITTRSSVLPHATTRLLLDGFSWNLIFEYYSKIYKENSRLTKI
jgi:hypothetical protein